MVSEETLQVVERISDSAEIAERVRKVLEPYRKEVKFAFLFGSYARNA